MEANEIIVNCNEKMDKATQSFKKELDSLRTGRPSPDIINPIKVEAYGGKSMLSELASVTVPDAKTMLINVWDKNLAPNVEKAVREAGLGFNPVVDGAVLKIYLPQLTEERRKELIKLASKYSEKYKIEVRNIRRETLEEFKEYKKGNGVSEDDIHLYNKQVEEATNKYIKNIENILSEKTKELEKL